MSNATTNVIDFCAYLATKRREHQTTPGTPTVSPPPRTGGSQFKWRVETQNGCWTNIVVDHIEGYGKRGKRVWRLGWNGDRLADSWDRRDLAKRFPDIEGKLKEQLRAYDRRHAPKSHRPQTR